CSTGSLLHLPMVHRPAAQVAEGGRGARPAIGAVTRRPGRISAHGSAVLLVALVGGVLLDVAEAALLGGVDPGVARLAVVDVGAAVAAIGLAAGHIRPLAGEGPLLLGNFRGLAHRSLLELRVQETGPGAGCSLPSRFHRASRPMSSDGAEWVRAPTEMTSTPVSAMARTVSSRTPPEASSTGRPCGEAAARATASRRSSRLKLSSMTTSGRPASASSS